MEAALAVSAVSSSVTAASLLTVPVGMEIPIDSLLVGRSSGSLLSLPVGMEISIDSPLVDRSSVLVMENVAPSIGSRCILMGADWTSSNNLSCLADTEADLGCIVAISWC